MNVSQRGLSGRQVDTTAFSRDGFTGPIRLFTPAQCDLVLKHLRTGARPVPVGWPKGGAASDRLFFDLATRPAVLAPLAPLLGDDVVLWGVDVVERDPGQVHPWHSDIESSAPDGRFVSIWIGIQNTSRESALGMLARSHTFGKSVQQILHERGLRREQVSNDMMLAWARELDPLAVIVQPDMTDGDAIVYDGRLWHATSNSRSQGRRIALLLQYAAAECPVRIPDFTEPIWPFRFREPRPPVVVVAGRGDNNVNDLVPPPPAFPDSSGAVSSLVRPLQLPLADDESRSWWSHTLFRGASPVLEHIGCHVSVLKPGYTRHPLHQHIQEELRIVLDGTADFLEGDATVLPGQNVPETSLIGKSHGAGTFSFCPPYLPHSIRNSHAAPVTYLVIYWRAAPLETSPQAAIRYVGFEELSVPAHPDPFTMKVLFEEPTCYLTKLHAHMSTLQPGAGYAAHVDDYDVVIVVLSGKVETLGRIVEPYGVIYYAVGEPHGMRNAGDGVARYLVFEFHAPRRSFRNRASFRVPSPEQIARRPAQEFRAFWTGAPLSQYEELSLVSLLARGQRVILYSYDKTLRVHDGVELADAGEVLPADRIYEFVHPNGETSPTPHANLFRYEALRKFGGWYCDLDIVLVGDQPPVTDVYFAREDQAFINNSVLRFPPGAPLMVDAAAAARGLMSSTEWGATGPLLLTPLAVEQGLSQLARPWTAAYPVRTTEVEKLFLPECREELVDRVAGADFVHLWNQIWRRVRIPKDLGPPEGSFLDAMFKSFGIRVSPGARMSAQAVTSWFREFNAIAEARRVSGSMSTTSAQLAHALGQARANGTDDKRLADIIAEAAELRWERDQLRKSTSWRVTAPLRAISQALQSLRDRS